ncbi:MAG: hypothetical protein JWN41_764, partial [Thermoleophilia bacterium]|nr:hypothetical protein [Thermoleophilia bacterium]
PGAVPPDALAKFLGEAASRRASLDEITEGVEDERSTDEHAHMHDHGDGHFHGAH